MKLSEAVNNDKEVGLHMKLSEAVTPKPKKNDIVVIDAMDSDKIQTISKGVAYVGSSRLPVMLRQLTFDSKKGNVVTWKANYQMNDVNKVLVKIRKLNQIISRMPASIKKDEQGLSQKDKRVLNTMVNNIYKEVAVLMKQQREEL